VNDWIGIPEDIEPFVGFVYIIRNVITEQYYLGQKKFGFKRSLKPLKGRKNKRHKVVESDWKVYQGSSMELQSDILKHGEDVFERTILRLCQSKAEMNYFETKYQFDHDVLLDPLSYNGIVNCRISKNQVKPWK
jgi:hypothetical protein